MLQRLAERLVNYLKRNEIIARDDEEVYVYGVQLVLSSAISFMVILLAGLLLGNFLLGALFLCCVVPLRMFCGGYHANSYLKCDLVFLGCFLANCAAYWLAEGLHIPLFSFIMGAVAVIMVWIFAPIENPNKPFSVQEGKRYRRISWGISLALYALCVLLYLQGWQPGAFMSWSLVAVAGLMMPNLKQSKYK